MSHPDGPPFPVPTSFPEEPETAREVLQRAARTARDNGFNGTNEFHDALADWFLAESEAHFHLGNRDRFVYDLPNMKETPSVRVARLYLQGEF